MDPPDHLLHAQPAASPEASSDASGTGAHEGVRPGPELLRETWEGGGEAPGERNRRAVVCGRCSSLLLLPEKAALRQRHLTLHKSRTAAGQGEEETLEWHWEVASMFDFENMGFSNTLSVGRPAKYLTCADCEQDVLGIHFLDEQQMYLATARVAYAGDRPGGGPEEGAANP